MNDTQFESWAKESWLLMKSFNEAGRVERYQKELERGTRQLRHDVSFSGDTRSDLIAWAEGLPLHEFEFDFDEGLAAYWYETVALTDEDIAYRKKYIAENPIPEGELTGGTIRWRKAVPFETVVTKLVDE